MDIAFDQHEYVVIDNGTGFVKAGFSGHDVPSVVLPTVVGEKLEIIESGNLLSSGDIVTEKKVFAFGHAALNKKDEFTLSEPIQRGLI